VNELLKKFLRVVDGIEAERGQFTLFGLFLRADTPYVYDVVASALWLDEDRLDGIRYIAKQVGDALEPQEMLSLSRIVPMPTNEESIESLLAAIGRSRKPIEIKDLDFAGARILSAYIISSHGHSKGAFPKANASA
jgi:hypothetical protein